MIAAAFSTLDTAVFAINAAGALAAVVVNLVAAGRGGLTALRRLHVATAVLAAIYVAGYAWVLFGEPGIEQWSSVMRGVSIAAWVIVWVGPGVVSIRLNRRLHSAVQARLEQMEADQ